MPVIRIDTDVYDELNERGKTEDSFNDVLRRLLKLSAVDQNSTTPARPSDAQIASLIENMHFEQGLQAKFGSNYELNSSILDEVIWEFLPSHWATSNERKRQIFMVIFATLSLDGPLKTRHIAASKAVAAALGIRRETVDDKCMRQLYGSGSGLADRFRKAMDKIEGAYWDAIESHAADMGSGG